MYDQYNNDCCPDTVVYAPLQNLCPTGCGTKACPLPKTTCPLPCATPACPPCVQPKNGISDFRTGIQKHWIVGTGNEEFVASPGTNAPTSFNYIPWLWLDPSIVDPAAPFVPRILEKRCDGSTLEATDRNTVVKKNPAGTVIATYTNPFSALNAGNLQAFRLIDTNPAQDTTVNIPAGQPTRIEAGTGINVVPLTGGFRIENNSIATSTFFDITDNQGLTLAGNGTEGNPYLLSVNCAALKTNCGLVTSVNGVAPDANGNVLVAGGGGSGINTITTTGPNGVFDITYPAAGVANINVNCANLKANCGLLDANSNLPVKVALNGTVQSTQGTLNFIPGANVTMSVVNDAVNNRANITINATGGGGTGTVTSVGIGNITGLATGTGGPVTTTGTLNYTLNTQNAGLVFAGPTTGAAAAPTFRNLAATDFGSNLAGNNQYIGTNASGVPGVYSLPAGGAVTVNEFTYTVPVTDGQTVFPLPNTPTNVRYFSVNGQIAAPTLQYTISGNTLTWLNVPFALQATNILLINYTY